MSMGAPSSGELSQNLYKKLFNNRHLKATNVLSSKKTKDFNDTFINDRLDRMRSERQDIAARTLSRQWDLKDKLAEIRARDFEHKNVYTYQRDLSRKIREEQSAMARESRSRYQDLIEQRKYR
ncbi:MAG: hypothetical protein WC552_02190 [Candidatus Omnitrophota bacterium]